MVSKNYLLFILFCIPALLFSQETTDFDLTFDVKKIFPYISVSSDQLNEAKTLNDLNERFESDWVQEYHSVELIVYNDSTLERAFGKSELLTKKQKEILSMADPNTEIQVLVKYLPKNNLQENEEKELEFSFTIDPDQVAEFPGGKEEMRAFFKAQAIDQLSKDEFRKHHLTAVKFEVDTDGTILNPHISEPSKSTRTDEVLLKAICNMPKWQPAEYKNGLKVKQEYVLLIGDMNSCVQNFYNTRTIWF